MRSCHSFKHLILLGVVSFAVIFPAYGSSMLAERIEVETQLPVFLNDNTATFVFKNLECVNSIRLLLTFKGHDAEFSPTSPTELLIGSRVEPQNRDVDISGWPDGDYEVYIKEIRNDSLDTGTLVRAIRKQTIALPAESVEPVKVAGIKTLFVDDLYIDHKTGIERIAHQAELIPIEPKNISPDYFRFYTWIKTFWYDQQGKMYVHLGGCDATDVNVMDIWVASTDLQNWEIVPEPVAVEKGCKFTRLIKDKVANRFTGQPTYRYYNAAQDGQINLNQVEIIYSGFEDGYKLGEISVPARSRVAVWEKPTGEYLVLSQEPLLTDKAYFADDNIGTWKDTNDNFGHKTISMDGKTLRFYQARAIPRNDPFRVYYDNVLFNRTLATWSTTDGLNWTPTYFESATREDPACLQNYGVHVFAEENGTLELAFMRMFDQVTQLTYTDLAYSRDGVQWNRFRNSEPFLGNGELGSWNFGFSYAANNRIRVEKDGKYFEPMQGRNVPHFMFLHAYSHADRSFMTPEFFMNLYGGRMSGENGLQTSEIWDWYGSWEEVAKQAKTDTATAALMCYRKDGWVSLSGDAAGGQLVTKVLQAGSKLNINAKTRLRGSVKVEVLDANGSELTDYCGDNAAKFIGDSVDSELSWSGGSITQLPDTPLRLRITIQDADIYSLQWQADGRIVYVKCDAVGTNDGSSWKNAYIDLQDALKNAQPGDNIWVARGTYKPTQETIDISKYVSFELKDNVALYGGFSGCETAFAQRNIESNATILSGDLKGDDGSDYANYADNSCHVVVGDYVDHTAILDGFTIADGCANLDWPHNAGGGLIISDYGSPTISNCNFSANYGGGGSAVWLRRCESVLTNCRFEGNESTYYAGAIYCYDDFFGSIVDCTFVNNVAANSGGAVRIRCSSPVVENCVFENNTSGNSGGGLMVTESSNPTVTGCRFTSNVGTGRGGGLYVGESSSAAIEACCFEGNNGPYGGGARFSGTNTVKMTGCTFVANGGDDVEVSTLAGAGIYNYNTKLLEIDRCYFLGNIAADMAGGICLGGSNGSTMITNCIFAANNAGKSAALRAYTDSNVVNCAFYGNTSAAGDTVGNGSTDGLKSIANSILWDGGNEIDDSKDVLVVNNCDIQGGWTGAGTGNINADPLFVDPAGADGTVGTVDDDYHLLAGEMLSSPCIDAGDNSAIPVGVIKDLDGRSRIANLIVDMGAYEKAGCGDENHSIPEGDVNGDCRVNIEDLAVIASNWFACTALDCD